MRGFDYSLLNVLEALLREQSVTGAAKRLHRSQPAVSRALAKLRLQLGDPILIRTVHGMTVTPRAREIATQLLPTLDMLDHALASRASFEPKGATTDFRISIGDFEGAVLLPGLIERMTRDAPEARLAVIHRRRPEAENALNTGEVGLAIGRFEDASEHLHKQRLFTDTFVLCGPEELLPADADLEALADLPHIVVSPSNNGVFQDLYDKSGAPERRVVASIPHFLLLPHILLGCGALAVAPRSVAELLPASCGLGMRVLPRQPAALDIAMMWHGRTNADPAWTWLRGAMVDAVPHTHRA